MMGDFFEGLWNFFFNLFGLAVEILWFPAVIALIGLFASGKLTAL